MNEQLKTRIRPLNSARSTGGKCVLYVMSRDQRVGDNHALLAAQKHALARQLPLAVAFCLYPNTGYRAKEHYQFMLEGLCGVEIKLQKLAIPFMLLLGNPPETLSAVLHHTEPDAVYFDFSPLRGPRSLQQKLASLYDIPMFVVDTHNLVPTWIVSEKYEVGAYTLRPKLHKKLAEYLVEPEEIIQHPFAWSGPVQSLGELSERIERLLEHIPKNGTTLSWTSGEEAARVHLKSFVRTKLESYAVSRNDPSTGSQSDLSPYLHFGHISSLRVALELQKMAIEHGSDIGFLSSPKMPKPEEATSSIQAGIDSLIEEMIVRKELADNYCFHQPNYDNLDAAPKWARVSLEAHRQDIREFEYSFEELRDAQTHDPAWNASQRQLTSTGKMHGYMRMYWAKKVLEWTESPEQAIDFLIRLNDFYSIDGGDPNGYAGILWSVGGVHDRPWFDRPIFGVVRYMNYDGLKRKFDIQKYCALFSSRV